MIIARQSELNVTVRKTSVREESVIKDTKKCEFGKRCKYHKQSTYQFLHTDTNNAIAEKEKLEELKELSQKYLSEIEQIRSSQLTIQPVSSKVRDGNTDEPKTNIKSHKENRNIGIYV